MKKYLYLNSMLIVTFLFFLLSCKEEGENGNEDVITPDIPATELPVLSTYTVREIMYTTALSGGMISSDGGATIKSRGVCWSVEPEPTIEDSVAGISSFSASGEFTSTLKGLKDGTKYFVRAFATNQAGTAYGQEESFITLEIVAPFLTTKEVTNIGTNSATGGGSISSDGGGAITARGICWNKTGDPTIDDSKSEDGEGTGEFTSQLTELEKSTVYYVRAYAINSAGTAYGDELSFTTNAMGQVSYYLVKVSNPTPEQQVAYEKITTAMDKAIWYYNNYTSFSKVLRVEYNPGVQTADGNINGTIRFGANHTYMHPATAMHEVSHTLGVGTTNHWKNSLIVGGIYQGTHATEEYRKISKDSQGQIKGDGQHFWPYGLNSSGEVKSDMDYVYHCRILEAMKKDGL